MPKSEQRVLVDDVEEQKWSQIYDQFIQSYLIDSRVFSDEESTQITYSFANLLGDILTYAVKLTQLRDKWKSQQFSPYFQGLTVLMESERTKTSFDFGFDVNGFYFEAAPHHLSNLRYMGDDFWAAFVELSLQPNFELIIREWASGDIADIAQKRISNKKSKVFVLLRDYMLYELSDSQYGTPGFATLHFHWPIGVSWNDLIYELSTAFKNVWKLDYQLWKTFYQKENKRQ